MLDLGASAPWQEALRQMTGETRVDASAMVEYFQPLLDWLKGQNQGQKIGWTVAANPLRVN
jgi:peptidyl-dipeptidase A